MPETIASAEISESFTDDATKDRADHGARQGTLRHTGRPEIDVVGRFVNGTEMLERVVGKDSAEIVPSAGRFQSAIPFQRR